MSSLIRNQTFRTLSTWHKPDEVNTLLCHVSATPCSPDFDGIPSKNTRVRIQKSQSYTDAEKVMIFVRFCLWCKGWGFFL